MYRLVYVLLGVFPTYLCFVVSLCSESFSIDFVVCFRSYCYVVTPFRQVIFLVSLCGNSFYVVVSDLLLCFVCVGDVLVLLCGDQKTDLF